MYIHFRGGPDFGFRPLRATYFPYGESKQSHCDWLGSFGLPSTPAPFRGHAVMGHPWPAQLSRLLPLIPLHDACARPGALTSRSAAPVPSRKKIKSKSGRAPRPVAVRLAGVRALEIAIAGKPDCYGWLSEPVQAIGVPRRHTGLHTATRHPGKHHLGRDRRLGQAQVLMAEREQHFTVTGAVDDW